ncbi:MAG: phage tail sheath subtilisin-like domain-containing protein [Ruminococcus sp.]|nr:phage tail sheath subtilisin-like domain-containing protein [Ruminococcus sp.]
MSLGLPVLSMIFTGKAVSAIERSARGIVAIVLKDDTEGGSKTNIYNKVDEVDFENWTETNYNYLKLVFDGAPTTVIAIRLATNVEGYTTALQKLKDLKWNYLTIPGIDASDVTTIAAWIKQYRDDERKTFKAVLPHSQSDHEGIINFTTENITSTITGSTLTAAEYCARIAGVLAGLSLARSSTYYVLTDISSAETPDDADDRIDNGELVIIFDGKKYKIGRGVNSLVTFTTEKTEDVRFIKIVEGMDLYMDDIIETFEDNYVGKIINDYDGKQMFVSAIGAYHKGLLGNVLDKSFDNTVSVDIESQRAYLESKGTDTSNMSDIEIAMANTGTKVFISSNVKFVNAMEDLTMNVYM